jgi:hypothetical protein
MPDLPAPLNDFVVQLAATVAGGLYLNRGQSKGRTRADEKFRLRTEAHIHTLADQVAKLTSRFDDLDAARERINASLDEPDVWVLLEVASTAAGFTSDELKHSALARAVAERLVADTDSTEALASAHAVEIISKLTPHHLQLLGLVALVYQVRPAAVMVGWGKPVDSSDLDLNRPDDGAEYKARSKALYEGHVDQVEQLVGWLDHEFARYSVRAGPRATMNHPGLTPAERDPSEATIAHLVSVNALIFDRQARRDLIQVLGPWRGSRYPASMGIKGPLEKFLYRTATGNNLTHMWEDWMESVTPTPAGLLVGIAVQDAKAGTTTTVDLVRTTYGSAGHEEAIWDARRGRLSDEFLRALDEGIRSLHRQGLGTFVGRLKKEI